MHPGDGLPTINALIALVFWGIVAVITFAVLMTAFRIATTTPAERRLEAERNKAALFCRGDDSCQD